MKSHHSSANNSGVKFGGITVLYRTHIPAGNWAVGREYFCCRDTEGTIFFAKVGDDGSPVLA